TGLHRGLVARALVVAAGAAIHQHLAECVARGVVFAGLARGSEPGHRVGDLGRLPRHAREPRARALEVECARARVQPDRFVDILLQIRAALIVQVAQRRARLGEWLVGVLAGLAVLLRGLCDVPGGPRTGRTQLGGLVAAAHRALLARAIVER